MRTNVLVFDNVASFLYSRESISYPRLSLLRDLPVL